MTSGNLSTVRLEGSDYRIRKILKDLSGRATTIVRGGEGLLYVAIPSDELGWLDKVAHDIGINKNEMPSLPDYQKALCGILTTQLITHGARCKACAKLRPKRPKSSKAITVAKIEPGQDFNLNGVIASIEVTHDRLFGQLESIETLLSNLKAYREAKDKLAELEQEAKDRIQAVRTLLGDGKL